MSEPFVDGEEEGLRPGFFAKLAGAFARCGKVVSKAARRCPWLGLPLFFCCLVLLDLAFRWFVARPDHTEGYLLPSVPFTIGWAALLTGFLGLLPTIPRRIGMGLVGTVFAILTVVHAAMGNIFGRVFSFDDLMYAGDGAKFFSWSYLDFGSSFLLWILLGVLLLVAAILFARRPDDAKERRLQRGRCLGAMGAAIFLLISVNSYMTMPGDTGMRWDTTYNPSDNRQIYTEFTDRNRCMEMAGLYQYTFRNYLVSFGVGGDRASWDSLDRFYEERREQISGENDHTGLLKGKNLILVMSESLDTWMISPDYTPNIWQMQQEGVNFANFYTPLFVPAGTFNTEIITQTGLAPAVTGITSSTYSTNHFPLSMARLFRKEGYTANSFHAASPSIYSRGSVHANLGFEAYHSHTEMNMANFALDSQMIGGYEEMVAGGHFYDFIISYSGHGPYNKEMGDIAAPHLEEARALVAKSGVTGSAENMEEYTRAIAHTMQLDDFLGELRDHLAADGLLEDTLIVVYGDHYGKYMTDKEFLWSIKGVNGEDDPNLYHTPCFLYGGGMETQRVEKYCSSLDLVPTLVNLFDLPVNRCYFVGDDIFGGKGGVVMLPNYAWYDGEIYYSGDYDGPVTQKISAITADVKSRLTASMDTLRCDYFKHWEQEVQEDAE